MADLEAVALELDEAEKLSELADFAVIPRGKVGRVMSDMSSSIEVSFGFCSSFDWDCWADLPLI